MAITTLSEAKTFLQISVTTHDDLIEALIPVVEADFLFIRNKDFDEDSNGTVYPDNASYIASQMIGYKISTGKSGQGLKSESIGSYAYTREDYSKSTYINGYPLSVVDSIERYIRMQ